MPDFKISHPFTTLGGKRYRRSDRYTARSDEETKTLRQAQFAAELADAGEVPSRPAPKGSPDPTPRVGTPEPEAPAPALEPVKSGEPEPDWSFQTIKAMRKWLDSASVALPGVRSGKTSHETLCRNAWTSGARPDPLYGFPGGPTVSPGMAGPDANDPEAFRLAIEAAGENVPRETADAYRELTTPKADTTSDSSTHSSPDAPEDASPDADATISVGSTDPSESINATADDAESATEPTETLPEGETGQPIPSGATADTPATREL